MKIEDAERIIEEYEELRRMAKPIAEKLYELQNGRNYPIDEDEIIADGGALYAKFMEYHRYGDYHDEREIYIPIEYLFDEEWQQKAEEEIQQKRDAEAERNRIQIEKERQRVREQEHKRYLELKAKFEGE